MIKAWLDHLYKLPDDNLRGNRVIELLVNNQSKAEFSKIVYAASLSIAHKKLADLLKKEVALR